MLPNLRFLFIIFIVGLSACKTSPTDSDSNKTAPALISTENTELSSEPVLSTADNDSPLIGPVLEQDVKSGDFNLYPMEANGWDERGWSIITPSEDSRLIYVSASTGDDETAEYYVPGDILDVNLPGNIKPFKTIEAALSKTREGFADWVLLEKGDVWEIEKVLKVKRGRSPSERAVISSYGSSGERPLIKSTASETIRIWDGVNFVAIKGISLYASHRDPESTDFVGWGIVPNSIGIRIYKNSEVAAMSVLLEDMKIQFFSYGISIDGGGEIVDVIIRRSIIANSYSETSHSQGVYAGDSSVLLEENIFYHNGWYKQQIGSGQDKNGGQATMFNHNTYFSRSHNTIFRKNVFISASSIHNKWTANSKSEDGFDTVQAKNIVIENNVYIGGEIGISAGGNTDFNTGFRWENIRISNNIMFAIGRDQPTNRQLGWYIDASDWDGGAICGNYLLHNDNDDVTNLKGIIVDGHSANVSVQKNLIIGLINKVTSRNAAALLLTGDDFHNIQIEKNLIQMIDSKLRPVLTNSFTGVSFKDNSYYSEAEPDQWFSADSVNYNLEDWQVSSGETGAINTEFPILSPMRSIESYAQSLGNSLEELIVQMTDQSESLWEKEYTVDAITDYIKVGYGSFDCN